jgi:4-hydroxy-tetrahydrodipicolinate reductase
MCKRLKGSPFKPGFALSGFQSAVGERTAPAFCERMSSSMTKRLILSGCNGKMGRVVSRSIQDRKDCLLVAGFDIDSKVKESFPVLADPMQFDGRADAVIDFSNPAFQPKLLAFGLERRIPLVVATTGLNEEQVGRLKEASKEIPIFFSANMSLGVNLLLELSKKAAQVLGGQFDIEIIEQHHNQKVDAPSGTALMLADGISAVLPSPPEYVYDRHSVRRKRSRDEIGIHSVRGGTIVGEHEVIFAGQDEVITLRHSAMSKQIFANGAIRAALFLCEQKPGLYNMGDLLSSEQEVNDGRD